MSSRKWSTTWSPPYPEYRSVHRCIRMIRGRASTYLCNGNCGAIASQWALKHRSDPFDEHSYVPLCRFCHAAYDHGDKAIRQCVKCGRLTYSERGRCYRKDCKLLITAQGSMELPALGMAA
jgi:hypothetical protein